MSVIAITLRYIFALSHNASTLWSKVIAFDSYRSRHMENDIVLGSFEMLSKCYSFLVIALRA
jgi:hypothetical protein